MNLPEPSIELEKELDIFEDAEACLKWDPAPSYYLYAYRDVLQIDVPYIYFGQGKDSRIWTHWDHTHNDILGGWIDYWKKSCVKVEEVASKVVEGLTQRQSCCLETYLIREHKPLANIKYYWTPDQSAAHSEDERHHHSQLMRGRKQPEVGIKKSARSRTNNFKIELYIKKIW